MLALMLLKVVEGGSAGAGSVARLEGIVAELGGEGRRYFSPTFVLQILPTHKNNIPFILLHCFLNKSYLRVSLFTSFLTLLQSSYLHKLPSLEKKLEYRG
jgi:hypothetical protein